MTDLVDNWCFGDAAIVSDTLRIAPLKHQNGPITLTTEECYSPFDLSSPQDANKKNLDLLLTLTWESKMECMEANIIYWISQDTQRYFGKDLSEEAAQESFKSCLHKTGECPANLRVKVQTKGACQARYWNPEKQLIKAPATHVGCTFKTKLLVKSVWLGESSWGVAIEATDLLVQREHDTLSATLRLRCPMQGPNHVRESRQT